MPDHKVVRPTLGGSPHKTNTSTSGPSGEQSASKGAVKGALVGKSFAEQEAVLHPPDDPALDHLGGDAGRSEGDGKPQADLVYSKTHKGFVDSALAIDFRVPGAKLLKDEELEKLGWTWQGNNSYLHKATGRSKVYKYLDKDGQQHDVPDSVHSTPTPPKKGSALLVEPTRRVETLPSGDQLVIYHHKNKPADVIAEFYVFGADHPNAGKVQSRKSGTFVDLDPKAMPPAMTPEDAAAYQ